MNKLRINLLGIGLMLFSITATFAQDIITLKNGDDIKGLVQEIGETDIKYKKYENPKGPNYTLKKSEILMIRYANGTKDIFKEEEKTVEEKVVPITAATVVDKKEGAKEPSKSNNETVAISQTMQNRRDVIVKTFRFQGILVDEIKYTDNKFIYYTKLNGKAKRIKQNKVALTLSFDEKFRGGKYPAQMDLQDFLSLPTYFTPGSSSELRWTVYATGKTNLLHLEKPHPDIYNSFVKATKTTVTGGILAGIGVGFFYPLMIPGFIINSIGWTKSNNVFMAYYRTCVNREVCAKYGIIITPYKMRF